MAQSYYAPDGTLMVWTGTGYHPVSAIPASAWGQQTVDVWDPNKPNGDYAGGWITDQRYGLTNGDWSQYGMPTDQNNWMVAGDANGFTGQLKSGDKEGTKIKFVKQGDSFVPTMDGVTPWDTNAAQAQNNWAGALAGLGFLGAGAGAAGAFGSSLGAAAGGAGGAAGTGGAGTGAITGAAETMWPGLASSGGNYASLVGAGAAPSGAGLSSGTLAGGLGGSLGGFGNYMALAPEVASGLQGWGTQTGNVAMGGEGIKPGGTLGGLKMPSTVGEWGSLAGKVGGALGALGGATGSQSGTGSALGGLLGAGLGYLDAKNQPNSLTIKNEIDPRLAQYAYGTDGTSGIAGAANNLMQQQLGQPNPLTEAGKQISGMANTLPNWNDLVAQGKSQWDANPFITQQQKAITDTMTRNLQENILPGIGSQAGYAGGYGGSRQGVAEALAMSRMNQDLAPALTGLASNAWESSQNRALNSAQSGGVYGLNNQSQQAGLLGTGAGFQANGPWNPINNATNTMRSLPGNSSTTQPLFSNPWANAIGGASLGSQIGGSTNWSDIFKNVSGGIGDISNWLKNWGN